MSTSHDCNQGPRFDFIEMAIKDMHETLKRLTDLLISKATSDAKIEALEKSRDDHESRLRVVEGKSSAYQWVERIVWAIVVAAVLAYFNLK